MDQMISQCQIQKKFNKCQFLKRALQLVFSVSVFSIFIWYSSGFSILPQSFNIYFSTCLFSTFTHTLERKYMFLICNGILAFLAKSSSSLMNPPSPPPILAFDTEFQASNNLSEIKVPISTLESFGSRENAPLIVEEEEELAQVEKQEKYYVEKASEVEEEQQEEDSTLFTETEGRENEVSIAKEEEEADGRNEEEEGVTGSGVVVTHDDELEDASRTMVKNEEVANADELNRKFEEFIRKMKEEMRIEAQRQPIAV